MDAKGRDLQFEVGDLVMARLKKERMKRNVSKKLQMRRIGPCRVLQKYGHIVYKLDLPKEFSISHIFNIYDLVKYKGPNIKGHEKILEMEKETKHPSVPKKPKLQEEAILNSRVEKEDKTPTIKGAPSKIDKKN